LGKKRNMELGKFKKKSRKMSDRGDWIKVKPINFFYLITEGGQTRERRTGG